MSNPPRTVRWLVPALLIVVWLGLGGWLGGLAGKLGEVVRSGAANYLPASAEARQVIDLNARFGEREALPAIVVYTRDSGLTAADQTAIMTDLGTVRDELGDELAGDPIGPLLAEDGRSAQLIVPFAGSDEEKITPYVVELRDLVNDRDGLRAEVGGPAGVLADLRDALGAVDLMLVLVTAGVILIILVLVYRSPLLPFVVLAVAGTALGVTQGTLYLLAKADVLTLGSEVQGILSVLVLGAATDYALLLIARYREELRVHQHKYDAMRAALRASAGPIVASAATVALGLGCLLISDLGLNRQLGPAGAIGIGCALVAMLTFLPAVLVLLGRAAFWPRRPAPGSAPVEHTGGWSRVAGWVGRRPRTVWLGSVLVLGAMALGLLGLTANGLTPSEMIIADRVESKEAQRSLGAHFPAGSGNPVLIIAGTDSVDGVIDAVRPVRHVHTAVALPGVAERQTRVSVTLDVAPDSAAATQAVRDIRTAVAGVPGAGAKVGGFTAVDLDFDDTAERDRIVIPVLLAVVFVILALLLRALVAPLLLLATVVLSFLAAVGVSAVVFEDLLGFPGVDSTFPLHAFVFLVALGVDYNIFLMTRVREEAVRHGTRRGTMIGLAVTGGVITSAGVVLAATFAALAVIPLVLMVELAFTVAFGVLLDTLLVRTLLVPALSLDIGRWIWWPGRLARVPDQPVGTGSAPPPPGTPPPSTREPETTPIGA